MTILFYLLVYCGGLLFALSGRPLYGLYIYFFSFYFHAPSQWWGASLPDIRWSLIAALVTLVVVLFKPPERGLRFWTFKENRLLAILALFVCLQQFWVRYGVLHMEYVILIVKFLILVFIIQNVVVSAKELRGVLLANVVGCAYLSYYGMSMTSNGRMEGLGGNGMDANLIGMHFAAVLCLGGYLLLERFRYTHIIVVGSLALIMMGLFMTESRGAIISLGVTGALAMVFRPSNGKGKFFTAILLAGVASAALMGPQIIERFEGMQKDNMGDVKDKSAESRMVIIEAQYEMWKNYPLLGYGHRGTLVQSPSFLPRDYLTEQGVRASHNLTMAMLVDHGIVGSLLYFGAIFIALFKIFSYRYHRAPGEKLSDDQRLYSNMLLGCILALFCFILGGQGANNKKLEADIWLLALIPLLHREIKEHNQRRRAMTKEGISQEVAENLAKEAAKRDAEKAALEKESFNV